MSIILVLLLFSDPVAMGNFGSSYTMGPTIAIYSILMFALTSNERDASTRRATILSVTIGSTVALLMNAYLLHGIAAFGIVCLYILRFKKDFPAKVRMVILTTFLSVNILFQAFYTFLSHDPTPFVLKQLLLGSNIVTSPNPYGSNGFLDFWGSLLANRLSYYWLSIFCLCILALLCGFMGSSLKKYQFKNEAFFVSLVLFTYFAQTFFYSNIFAYSWVSCAMYLLKFFTILFFAKYAVDSFGSRVVGVLLALIVCILLILPNSYAIFPIPDFSISRNQFWLICWIGFSILVFHKSVAPRLYKQFVPAIFSILFLVISTLFHNLPLFQEHSVPYEASFNVAKKDYEQLTSRRQVVLSISNSLSPMPRFWFTPSLNNPNPLTSSQLYLYSLISGQYNKHNCAQVDWAANYRSVIVSFDNPRLTTALVNKVYLNVCGFMALDLPLDRKIANQLNSLGGKVWELKPKS